MLANAHAVRARVVLTLPEEVVARDDETGSQDRAAEQPHPPVAAKQRHEVGIALMDTRLRPHRRRQSGRRNRGQVGVSVAVTEDE